MVRVKFRYVVVKVVLEDESKKDGGVTFSDHSIYNCVLKLVQKHWGDLGEAAVRSGLRCKYCNDQTRIAIIRMKHRPHRFVTSVLPLASVIGDHSIKLHTLYNGATIMQCNKFIVEHQRAYLDRIIGRSALPSALHSGLEQRVMSYTGA